MHKLLWVPPYRSRLLISIPINHALTYHHSSKSNPLLLCMLWEQSARALHPHAYDIRLNLRVSEKCEKFGRKVWCGSLIWTTMERLLEDFSLEAKNPSVEAMNRWRSAVSVVKNPRRRFRMVSDLPNRAQAIQIKVFISLFWGYHVQFSFTS